jgi:hypothetical protein
MLIFCDYLDVTYAPNNCPYPELNQFLLGLDFRVSRNLGGFVEYSPPAGPGKLIVSHRSRYARISASGGVCSYLRAHGTFEDYLFILGTSPHKVTRLDSTLDVPTDGAAAMVVFQERYPSGQLSLTRKSLKIDYIQAVRPDGLYTGTMSVGYGTSARFKAKVYDKAWEALCKRGEHLPPTTRFETIACKDSGATLRDAAMPASLFWHIASPALLTRPEGIPEWEPNVECNYLPPKRVFDPAETLRRRIEHSAELEVFSMLADSMGNSGREYLLHLIKKRLEAPAPQLESNSQSA